MAKIAFQVSWHDVPHLSDKAKSDLISSIPLNQREARIMGVPQLGAGAIYQVPEADILCDPFELPAFWRCAYALDVGWKRTAAIWGALDPDNDVVYLYSEHYRGQTEPAVHAQAIQARGKWIPGVIDPASRGRQQADGEQLLNLYINLGLTNLIPADNSVEAGIYEVWSRLSTGRLRVFKTLQNFLSEYRIYRRDEKGKIVKENDHLMDAVRYLVMSGLRIAASRPLEDMYGRPEFPGQTTGRKHQIDYNPMAAAYNPKTGQDQGPKRTNWMPHGQRR